MKQSREELRPESPPTWGTLREGNRDEDIRGGRRDCAGAPRLGKAFLRLALLNLFPIVTPSPPQGAFLDIFFPQFLPPAHKILMPQIYWLSLHIPYYVFALYRKIFFTTENKLSPCFNIVPIEKACFYTKLSITIFWSFGLYLSRSKRNIRRPAPPAQKKRRKKKFQTRIKRTFWWTPVRFLQILRFTLMGEAQRIAWC